MQQNHFSWQRLCGDIAYLVAWVYRPAWLLRLIPVRRLIPTATETDRMRYTLERKIYRGVLMLQGVGAPLSRRDYQYYKLIAEKYHWPYIKELYED